MTKIFHSEEDLFYLQQDFIGQAGHQTEVQCGFGHLMVGLLETVEQYERQKLVLIKEILGRYLQAASNAREGNEAVEALRDILEKQTEEVYIGILYSSEELIPAEVLKEVSKVEKKLETESIDIKEVKKFLKSLKCPPFDHRNLILKEYSLYFKADDQLWNCLVLLTVDGFMNVYESREEQEGQEEQAGELPPDYCMALRNVEMGREGDIKLSMRVKKRQLLSLSREEASSIDFVFMNEDQREEFIEFIAKILPV